MEYTESIEKHRRRVGWTLFAASVMLAVGWPIAILVSWSHILSSHTRLGYLLGDLGMVAPLGFLGWFGLTHSRRWGPAVFLLFAGAAAFDTLHFGIYLIQEKFLAIPAPVYIVLILAILGLLAWLALWEIRRIGDTARLDSPAIPADRPVRRPAG